VKRSDLDILRVTVSSSEVESRVALMVERVNGIDGSHVKQPNHHLVMSSAHSNTQ
jgi:hypothetical protein